MRTACATEDEFVALFKRNCDEWSIFAPTDKVIPQGSPVAFSLELADGQPMLRGLGVVIDQWSDASNHFAQPGVHIEFDQLTSSSGPVLDRLLAARAASSGPRQRPASMTQRRFAVAPLGSDYPEEESVVRDVRHSITREQEAQPASSGAPIAELDERSNHTARYAGPMRGPAIPARRAEWAATPAIPALPPPPAPGASEHTDPEAFLSALAAKTGASASVPFARVALVKKAVPAPSPAARANPVTAKPPPMPMRSAAPPTNGAVLSAKLAAAGTASRANAVDVGAMAPSPANEVAATAPPPNVDVAATAPTEVAVRMSPDAVGAVPAPARTSRGVIAWLRAMWIAMAARLSAAIARVPRVAAALRSVRTRARSAASRLGPIKARVAPRMAAARDRVGPLAAATKKRVGAAATWTAARVAPPSQWLGAHVRELGSRVFPANAPWWRTPRVAGVFASGIVLGAITSFAFRSSPPPPRAAAAPIASIAPAQCPPAASPPLVQPPTEVAAATPVADPPPARKPVPAKKKIARPKPQTNVATAAPAKVTPAKPGAPATKPATAATKPAPKPAAPATKPAALAAKPATKPATTNAVKSTAPRTNVAATKPVAAAPKPTATPVKPQPAAKPSGTSTRTTKRCSSLDCL